MHRDLRSRRLHCVDSAEGKFTSFLDTETMGIIISIVNSLVKQNAVSISDVTHLHDLKETSRLTTEINARTRTNKRNAAERSEEFKEKNWSDPALCC